MKAARPTSRVVVVTDDDAVLSRVRDALPDLEVAVAAAPWLAEEPTGDRLAAMTYREALALGRERATREYVLALLADVDGNVTRAAKRAGVARESFHRLLSRYAIRPSRPPPRGSA